MVHLPTFATSSVVRLAALFSTSTQRHPDHVAAVSTTSTDPCAALMTHVYSGVHVNSVLGVEACFNSFPEIKAADKEAQISTLKKYFELYPYRLIAANSSAPSYTSNVDLFAQLDAIASDASVTTEFELHNAIKLQLNKLNDGHVTYAPQCFSNFVYMQPFNLLPVYTSNGEIAVVVDSWSISQTSRFWQPVFKGFWGSLLQPNMIAAQVTAINGDDPVDFLQSLADTQYGIAHAPETRFNYIFPSYAGINVTNSKFSFTDRFPESDSITYTLKISTGSAVNVSVPWAALLPNETAATGFSSASMYYKTFCTSASNNKKSSIDLDAFAAELQDNSGMSLAKRGSALVRSQLLDDGSSAFYLLSDGITGVFALTKFHPPVTDTMDEAQATKVAKTWIKNIAMGLQALEKAGAKKLIIELTGNGGGLAMMGFFLAQV
ncbi:hypothetical protein BC830DRAFT_427525 [Chytriomyces sp. MP71]|nr:hypothetical protein BC830DRAFT_427525 [Chytriomyces sp. MP71]